jgi:LysR family D-serine deaminase transcriptional activator
VLTGNDNVNLQRAGIDLAIYFDDAPSSQLSHHFLMDEAIVPVCTPNYARQLQLTSNPANLRHCTLLHDRQAWSNDSGTDEWLAGRSNLRWNCRNRRALASIVLI